MCECGYCRLAVDWLCDKCVCLPVYIRLSYHQANTVGVLDAQHRITFADGTRVENLTKATAFAFYRMFGKSMPRELRYMRPEAMWTVHIANLGSVPLEMISTTQWGSCEAPLSSSTVCSASSPVVELGAIEKHYPHFAPLVGLMRKQSSSTTSKRSSTKRKSSYDPTQTLHALTLEDHVTHSNKKRKSKAAPRPDHEATCAHDAASIVDDTKHGVKGSVTQDEADEDAFTATTWSINSPVDEWTDRNVHDFLLTCPELAPQLIGIESVIRPSAYGNPFCMCNLRHPVSNEVKRVRLSGTILALVPQYVEKLDIALVVGSA